MKSLTLNDIKHPTDIFHVEIVLEDTFTFAKAKRQTTVSGQTLSKMIGQIGDVVIDRFNGANHETLRLKAIYRA